VSRYFSILKVIFLISFLSIGLLVVNECKLSYTFPIRTVRVYGAHRVNQQELKEAVQHMVGEGFFAVNVDAIRDHLLQIAWIGDIYVKRIWPDQLQIVMIEKQAVARWMQRMQRGSQILLASDGEFFSPETKSYPDTLPAFVGPVGKQLLMLHYFNDINRLLVPLHAKISYLELTPYLSLRVRLDNGVFIEMGHKEVLARMRQLVRVYPKMIGERVGEIEYVDLRYPNGIAVRWKKEHGIE
jgi:cell division protein FtsQ